MKMHYYIRQDGKLVEVDSATYEAFDGEKHYAPSRSRIYFDIINYLTKTKRG